MRSEIKEFSTKNVAYIFDATWEDYKKKYPDERYIIITDDHIFEAHMVRLTTEKVIRIAPGEENKKQQTADQIIKQLLELDADKKTTLVGMGGGVVTDLTGYVASVFKRGIKLVQVPTSVLAMVDAAVGGKNGVDVGAYKNMVGTIYQPEAVLFDVSFLETLPREEWVNGFAEIIKHACIKDKKLFHILEQHDIDFYKSSLAEMAELVEKNVGIKTSVVLSDEFETGDRKLLNYGHTLGHAIENKYELSHGKAISIGMVAASRLSQVLTGLTVADVEKIITLLAQYDLPVRSDWELEPVWNILLADKKRSKNEMAFILLNKIGEGTIQKIPLTRLKELLSEV